MQNILVVLCFLAGVTPVLAQQPPLVFENSFPNLTFTRTVAFENHGTDRVYVVQQTGEIKTMLNDPAVTETNQFLDLSERVVDPEEYGEAGLLSLAFHPDYSENGYFYVYYVTEEPMSTGEDTLHSVLARFERSSEDPTKADPESEKIFLEIPKPTPRHNGGGLAFGPDGYLYLSLGEGSRGGDAFDHAQDRTTLLGSVLRIDVDNPSDERPYGIPSDNPYAENERGYREEIYAYGFRNPWRLSIDSETGDVWVGDVGENDWEEVNVVTNGSNYGWPIMEGNECFRADTCDQEGLVGPVVAYPRTEENGGCITGGHVYRGEEIPELQGKYVYGDWISTKMWILDYEADGDTLVTEFEPVSEEQQIQLKHYPSFATDKDGELYYLSTYHGEKIYRFKRNPELNSPKDEDTTSVTDAALELSGPNPSSFGTTITFKVSETQPVKVAMYDLMGREVTVLYQGVVAAGTVQQLQVPAGRFPTGTYFCRMTGREFSRTRKIVLLR